MEHPTCLLYTSERDERLWNLACDIAAESLVDRFDAVCVKRVVSDEREAWYYRIGQETKVLNAQSVYRWMIDVYKRQR